MGDPEVEEAFRFFDKGEKGHLSPEEFTQMVQSLGDTPTQAKLGELLAGKTDIDREGVKAMMPAIKAEKLKPEEVHEAVAKAEEIAGSMMDDGQTQVRAIKYEKYVKW